MSDIIDESIYEKSLLDPFEVGGHINTDQIAGPIYDGKLIFAITQFNLGYLYKIRLNLVL